MGLLAQFFMNKKNVATGNQDTVSVVPVDQPTVDAPSTAPTPQQERISNEDMRVLEIAKARLETAQAQAKEAAAKLETAQITYQYIVLQSYMKNNLTANDALSEDGLIIRGGATQQR